MSTSSHNVVTRFAPSPTGLLHLGNYRTALFNFLYAKQHDGKFILRIEDTDTERSRKEYEEDIVESLKWLSLPYAEMHRQSERSEIYKKYLQKLLDEGKAYLSQEESSPEAGNPSTTLRTRRSEVIRFKNPGTKITFSDLIRGDVTFDTEELGDFVIAKSISEPIFHFAVVVDDFEMGITHVIRGEDHISNTPRQILIQEAIGAPRPLYAHLPLILAPDRSKLSKRNGGISIRECKKKGYIPAAIVNYLALLGWNPGTEQEILSLENLLLKFRLEKIQKGGAVFNEDKLNWINKEYLRLLPEEEVDQEIRALFKEHNISLEETMFKRLLPTIVERIEKFEDVRTLISSGELDFALTIPALTQEKIVWKNSSREETVAHLEKALTLLQQITEKEWNTDMLQSILMPYAEEKGKGHVLWPIRFALSGKEKSPDPFTISAIIGKEQTLARLKQAIDLLRSS